MNDPSPIALEMQNLRRVYQLGGGDVAALDGVSLQIRQGELVAIMGPSGSGKSTLLNQIGCLDRPTEGTCLIGGQDTAHLDDDALSALRLEQLGFVFQSFHLLPQLSVEENIALPLIYKGENRSDALARASELAALVNLSDRMDHRPSELSGGQQQRVAIARALVNDPPILLADEPTGNLDSATGEAVMAMLERLNRQGKTLIIVTHTPEVAARARRVITLRDGRIEQDIRQDPPPLVQAGSDHADA
ncbi:MAG: ABC transporter ATP-binding protein [Alphaproteobacteria bacterium]